VGFHGPSIVRPPRPGLLGNLEARLPESAPPSPLPVRRRRPGSWPGRWARAAMPTPSGIAHNGKQIGIDRRPPRCQSPARPRTRLCRPRRSRTATSTPGFTHVSVLTACHGTAASRAAATGYTEWSELSIDSAVTPTGECRHSIKGACMPGSCIDAPRQHHGAHQHRGRRESERRPVTLRAAPPTTDADPDERTAASPPSAGAADPPSLPDMSSREQH